MLDTSACTESSKSPIRAAESLLLGDLTDFIVVDLPTSKYCRYCSSLKD